MYQICIIYKPEEKSKKIGNGSRGRSLNLVFNIVVFLLIFKIHAYFTVTTVIPDITVKISV